ncbi:hypothetical protein [[Kitasatospora] papulosa]|uniref:hypothetical protein n=1 Tax=[Kitasatospora] papulosa TaxID=1464011 RepID=UPI0036272402
MSALYAALAALAGYGLGRYQPGPRCLNWAEESLGRGRRHPAWWAAQVVFAVALAWTWTVHPRRTLANVRSWREDRTATPPQRGPALQFRTTDHATEEPK